MDHQPINAYGSPAYSEPRHADPCEHHVPRGTVNDARSFAVSPLSHGAGENITSVFHHLRIQLDQHAVALSPTSCIPSHCQSTCTCELRITRQSLLAFQLHFLLFVVDCAVYRATATCFRASCHHGLQSICLESRDVFRTLFNASVLIKQ